MPVKGRKRLIPYPGGHLRNRQFGGFQQVDGGLDPHMVQVFQRAGVHGTLKFSSEGRAADGAHVGQLLQGDRLLIMVGNIQHRCGYLIH